LRLVTATVRDVQHVTYSHRLHGRMTAVGPGLVDVELAARRSRVASRLSFLDEATFRGEGTVDFGGGDSMRFRSLSPGTLARSPDPALRHGTTVLEVHGGSGRYAGARGRITSNFVLAEDGRVTDIQVGVIFLGRDQEEERRR
jgi:hypothetical protein